VEVAFEPYKRISFNSHIVFDNADDFADCIASANPPEIPFRIRLFWANGILFRVYNHAPSETFAKEILSGHLIWDHVELARMPEFRDEIKPTKRPLGTINVIDVSKHAVFEPFTAWIRDNLIK